MASLKLKMNFSILMPKEKARGPLRIIRVRCFNLGLHLNDLKVPDLI